MAMRYITPFLIIAAAFILDVAGGHRGTPMASAHIESSFKSS
jgi:hypothetical protein